MQLLGWLVALVYNAAADWAGALAGDWEGCQVRTLRRASWDRPGTLYQTPQALIGQLDRFGGREALGPAVDALNAERHCHAPLELIEGAALGLNEPSP